MLHLHLTTPRPQTKNRLPLRFSGVLLCWLGWFVSPVSGQTAMQSYVEAMQPGWNLGNTLDATPSETAWGNPLVTQEFIQQIAAQGFKSIRIPVTWDTGNRIGPAPSYTIDPAWLDRVQQIVDWSLDAGLYVMLNLHHDSGWLRSMPSNHDVVLAKFNAIWSQIAPRFRDHSQKLMLESINEPEFDGVNDATKNALLHELNTSFFHIVRDNGGGNATRPLVLPTVVTNASQHFLDALKATMTGLNDPNLIATIHFYGFWPFSVNIAGGTTVDAQVIGDINTTIDNAYNTFVANGIPVVVGEVGLLSYDPNNQAVERGEMLKFFELFTAAAQSKSITWQLWDAGNFFNRATYQWRDPEVIGYFMQSVTSRSSTAARDLVFVESGAPVDVAITLNLNGNTFVSLTNGGTTLTPGVDYTLAGSVLTLKASLLASHASGAYGEKTVLDANFSAGMPWKFRVHHLGVSVLSAASSTKGVGLTIPVAFNGDLMATMEAKYVGMGYPYPGPAEWTSFKEYNSTYVPSYGNNTVTLKKEFFAATNNNPIDLTFHMWSGRELNYRLTLRPVADLGGDAQEWLVYDESLPADWNDSSSWSPRNLAETTAFHSGTKSISITPGAWGAAVLSYGGPAVDTSAYKTLVFWVHGGMVGGQNIGVGLVRGDDWSAPDVGIAALAANTWRKVEIPLDELGVEGSANITRVFFQNWTGEDAPTFYIDDIKLTTAYASDLVFVDGISASLLGEPVSLGSQTVAMHGVATFNVASPDTVHWSRNGAPLDGKTSAALTLTDIQPADTGIYAASVTKGAASSLHSGILGVSSSEKVIGQGEVVGSDIEHPNGNTFDQVLLTGAAEAITADHPVNHVTRTSFIDLDDDIVQVEFSGPGTLSLVLDGPTGPATPLNYNQPDVEYMKGHASIVITGATEQTNLSIFSVGRLTAVDRTGGFDILLPISPTNQPANNGSALFSGHGSTDYDGVANLAFVAISSADGKFGGIRTANTSYFSRRGFTGIYAPGVTFTGPVFVGNITAFDDAMPVLMLGSAANTRVAGGDLDQANGQPVRVSGVAQLVFAAGIDSHGNTITAKSNSAVLQQDGLDVTAQIVVNP